MATIDLEGVGKVFDGGSVALADLDLSADDGEFVVLVGPSGSGKSTALRIVAGLEEASSGTVRVGGRVMNDVAPKDRDIAMVFQNYALYPHMSVEDNLGFSLRLRGEKPDARRSRVGAVAARLSISRLVERLPRQLSGGQRQRVALGRAIVREPQAFLMDEPLSNLDAKLRVDMRAYIQRLQRELGTTTLYVTHDQTEAMTMGDRVAVLRDGRLEQLDVPQELYDRPANIFVAGFIGSPAMSLVLARVVGDEDGVALVVGEQRVRLPDSVGRVLLDRLDRDVVVGVRPEDLSLEGGGPSLEARVELVEALGSDLLVHAELDAPAVLTASTLEVAEDMRAGETNGGGDLAPRRPERAWLTARVSPTTRPEVGRATRLFVDPERLHLFDPESERTLRA